MTEGPRPGSRSERHLPRRERRRARRAAEAPAAAPAAPMPPVIEALRPEPPRSARRAQQRVGRRRRLGRGVLVALLVVAIVGAAGTAFLVLRNRDAAGDGGKSAPTRTQSTLLVQIPGPTTGDAVASALLVTDPAAASGSVILVPSRMLSQIPGHGSSVFGEALALGGVQLSQDALANQLGVVVDRAWLLKTAELAALVDSMGGVEVEVDVDLPGGPQSSEVVLRPGRQLLGGAAAAAFATYGLEGQPELGRLTRFQVVLVAVLDKLPKTAPEIAQLLAGAPGTAAPVAESLRLLAAARAVQKLAYKVIPVTDIDSGSDEETTRVDPDQLAALVAAELAPSVPPNAFRPENEVVVRNGVGTAGLGQSVTRRLNAVGFVVVQSGNADTFGYARSQVAIFDSTEESVQRGEAVAAALGLTPEAVEVSDLQQSVADVIVTIGADYSEGPARASVGP